MKPVCKVCGKVCRTDGGAMGVRWACPEGHYRQYLYSSQDKKEYYEVFGFWNKMKAFWRTVTGNNKQKEKTWEKDH